MSMGSRGGSELMAEELKKRLSPKLLDGVKIYLNNPIPEDFNPSHINIFWNQHNHDQPIIKSGFSQGLIERFDTTVYVSHWQYDRYKNVYKIPSAKSTVLRNAVDTNVSLIPHNADKKVIRLIYTSTPFRGLDVLLDAFDLISDLPVQLEIFSSTKIYGQQYYNLENRKYEALFDRASAHPKIIYQGYADNLTVRRSVHNSHIFSYPSVFEETSCIAAIEAGLAGLNLVVTNLGALFETCAGFAHYVNYDYDRSALAQRFADALRASVMKLLEDGDSDTSLQKAYFNRFYSWDQRVNEWEALLRHLRVRRGMPLF